MKLFEANTANAAWIAAAKVFVEDQDRELAIRDSRCGEASELMHACFVIKRPSNRWVASRLPAMNPAFALAEVLWILTGSREAEVPTAWNPQLRKYCGDESIYYGAYGYRLRIQFGIDQLERAYRALSANPDSRQVVLQIWNSKDDLPHPSGVPRRADIPCNVVSMLKIRNGRLEWTQILRSNDLFLGVPHNFVQFTLLQEIIAGWIGVEVGGYHHMSDSLHLYTSDSSRLLIDETVMLPESTEDLRHPWDDWQVFFRVVARRMQEMLATTLTKRSLMSVAAAGDVPASYEDILVLLGAEIARRKGWDEVCDRLMADCNNQIYRLMWLRWNARVAKHSESLAGSMVR